MRRSLTVRATACLFGGLGPALGCLLFGIWEAFTTLDPKTAAAGLRLLIPPFAIFPYWLGSPPALATGLAHALISPLVRSRKVRLSLTALIGAVTTLLWIQNVIRVTGRAPELVVVLTGVGAGSAVLCALLTDSLWGLCAKAAPSGESQKMPP